METTSLDNTRRSTFQTCPFKYFLQHKEGIESIFGSTALRYGSVWHSAMEAFYRHISQHGWTRDGKAIEKAIFAAHKEWEEETAGKKFFDDYRTLPNLLNSLVQYVSHFSSDDHILKIIEPEAPFKILITPDDEEYHLFPGLLPFHFTGVIDLVVSLQGQPWILDFKTTGKRIQDVVSTYRRSTQFIGYTYASTQINSTQPEGFLISLHHLSSRKSPKTGLYGAVTIDFHRTAEIYSQTDLSRWRRMFLKTALEIQLCEYHSTWPHNFDSCFSYGKCTYYNLCSQNVPYPQLNLEGFAKTDPWNVLNAHEAKRQRREKYGY